MAPETVTRTVPATIPVPWTRTLVWGHAVLQMLDLATTFLALQAGGMEANPISRALIEGGGWWAYGGVKVFVALCFLALHPTLRAMARPEQRFITGTMVAFGAFMAFVVVNNALIAF